jgi:GMP synthase (glutamine-hydrolysing)
MNEKIYIVKHVADEGPGLLGNYFQRLGWDTTVIELSRGDILPEDVESEAAVVILGGPMNVYEEDSYPFLKAEDAFIKRIVSREIPFLGICLGAQLLAKACGAAVTKSPIREVGWYNVNLTAEAKKDHLFKDLSKNLPVYQWHGDTFGIPDDAALLATAPGCPNQAFRVGSFAYGLQFHPELTAEMEADWTEKAAKEIPCFDLEQSRRKGKELRKRFDANAELLLANFQGVVESATRIRRTVRAFVEAPKARPVELWWSLEERALLSQHTG